MPPDRKTSLPYDHLAGGIFNSDSIVMFSLDFRAAACSLFFKVTQNLKAKLVMAMAKASVV